MHVHLRLRARIKAMNAFQTAALAGVLAILIAATVPAPAEAQILYGGLVGNVTEASASAVPGAQVTIVQAATARRARRPRTKPEPTAFRLSRRDSTPSPLRPSLSRVQAVRRRSFREQPDALRGAAGDRRGGRTSHRRSQRCRAPDRSRRGAPRSQREDYREGRP